MLLSRSARLSFACLLAAPLAHAHISLESGGTHRSRYGDADTAIKDAPCGRVNGTRGSQVYTYEAGSTIAVTIQESIPHPGYFRIAFDADGDDGFRDPVSIDPLDPARACPNGPTDRCGTSDFYNSPEVLMDNLDPHLPAPGDFLNPRKFTWQVTLPNVECSNCTLQIIQVMEDDLFHGPYDVTPGVGVADVYHQCIDLVLTPSSAPGAGGAPTTGTGGASGAAGAPAGAAGGATGAGGTLAGGAPGVGGGAAGLPGSGGLPAGPLPTGADAGAEDNGDSSSADEGSCRVARPAPSPGAPAVLFLLGLVTLARRRR